MRSKRPRRRPNAFWNAARKSSSDNASTRSASSGRRVQTMPTRPSCKRQHGDRAVRRETLVGRVVVEALRRRGRDDGGLVIVDTIGRNAGLFAHQRAHAVCGDHEPRAQRARGPLVFVADHARVAVEFSVQHLRGRNHLDLRRARKPRPERRADHPVRQHVAQRLEALLGRVDARGAEAALLRDMDATDRRGLALHAAPRPPASGTPAPCRWRARWCARRNSDAARPAPASPPRSAATRSPSGASASASDAPTRPPPTMARSNSAARSGRSRRPGHARMTRSISAVVRGSPDGQQVAAVRGHDARRPRCARRCSTSASARPWCRAGM